MPRPCAEAAVSAAGCRQGTGQQAEQQWWAAEATVQKYLQERLWERAVSGGAAELRYLYSLRARYSPKERSPESAAE